MVAFQYLQDLHDSLATVLETSTVAKRYEFIQNQIVGSSVAQTASCWLDYPTVDNNVRYHTVLATDEYFTYSTQNSQQKLIESAIAATQQRLIITVRDFKNSSRYDLGNNIAMNLPTQSVIITENVRNSSDDRQSWLHDTFVVNHTYPDNVKVQHIGTVTRRAVYFKQLAKFCFDAGCKSFRVMPNVLYRPLFKNHVEHIILVDF